MRKLVAVVVFSLLVDEPAARADSSGSVAKPVERTKKRSVVSGSACVDANGSWVNWPWPNVPTLSPRCPAAPEPAKGKQ